MMGTLIVRRLLTSLLIAAAVLTAAPAFAIEVVPPGNRHAEQPDIPGASVRRTKGTKTSFDRKYDKVHELLATDHELMGKIKKVSAAYGIDPIHVVGAIVGEHTYNVDAYDRLQSYYVKAAIPTRCGAAERMSGKAISAARPSMARASRIIASAPYSSSLSTRARLSGSARSIR
jgi:hypothetical protein